MNDCVRYERALKKELRCGKKARKRLLEQFRDAQKNFLEENLVPDMAALQEAFGPPAEMASTLMASTTEEERTQYKKQKWICRIVLGVLIAALLGVAIYLLLQNDGPVEYHNDIIDYGTLPSSTPTD